MRGLYVIIDPQVTGGRDPAEIAAAAIRGGARILQLRDKLRDKGEILPLAVQMQKLCQAADVDLIVNDHADLAAVVGCAGMHVGQTDLPVSEARRVLSPGQVVGRSNHELDELIQSQEMGADHVAFGAIFATTTKGVGGAPQGTARLRLAREVTKTPLVAIGGVTAENAAAVVEAGADAICVAAAVGRAADPRGRRGALGGRNPRRRGAGVMPSKYNDALADIANQAIEQLTLRNQAREHALSVSREVIRYSANAIRAVHRGQFDQAKELAARARTRLEETESIRRNNPEIYFAGFLADARKEFSEANVTLAVISGGDIPLPQDLGVDAAAYLNGMAEVIGEVRRYILDELRRDSLARCQELMDVMDEIYSILVTVDFPRGSHRRAAAQHRQHAGRARAHPGRPDHGHAAAQPGATAGPVGPGPRRGRLRAAAPSCVKAPWRRANTYRIVGAETASPRNAGASHGRRKVKTVNPRRTGATPVVR